MRSATFVAAPLFLLVACQSQPPSMSVREAKTLTADFSNTGFVPPPRTITDITVILSQKAIDSSYRNALLARLVRPPDANTSAALAVHHRVRADAALTLGMLDQAVASAQESVRYAREAKQDAVAELILLGLCEYYASGTGDIELSEAYEISRKGGRPSLVAIRELTEISAERGNIAGARAFVEESDRALQAQRLAATSPFLAKATADNAETHFFYEMSAGRYQAAEIWQRKAVENWRAFLTSLSVDSNGRTDYNLGSFHRHFSVLHAELARSLMAQLRSTEAETVARDGLVYALQHTGRSSPGVVIAAESVGQALFAQGRVADAEKVFATVTEIREELGIPADNGRNWTANAMAMQRHWTEALLLYNDAKQSRTPGDPYVVFPRVMALYHVERSAEGLALIQPLAERRARTYGENSADTALAKGFVGVGLALQGETRRAMATFEAVLPLLLRSDLTRGATEESGSLNHELRRYVLEAYLGELSKPGLKSGQSAVATAFQVTDSLRVAVTDRAVAASLARANLRDPGLADVARREQDTLGQLASRFSALANALSRPFDQQNAPVIAALRAEIDMLKQARAVLTQEIEKRFPEYANLVNPPPASVEQARAALTGDEALVALYAGEKESYVWALRKTGDVAFAVVPLRRDQLAAMVGSLRRSLDPNARTLGEIPAFDVELAHQLYAAILQPVEAGWTGAKTLITVPHGPMAQLPFAMLVTRPVAQPKDAGALFSGYRDLPFLVREVAVAQVPSVAALTILRGLPMPNPGRRAFVGFGDPWFSAAQAAEARAEQTALAVTRGVQFRAAPDVERRASANLAMLPRLPDTALEVREIAATLQADPAKDVFLGPAANERTVRTLKLDDRQVVMFATHGLVPGDLDGLSQPALALTAPAVANVEGDGLLTMEKILGLKLDADWVVLSACNTAAGAGAGADAVSGLGRAFFYAGARALLVTHWPVESTSARLLTTTTFQRQAADAKLSRADALRLSMLDLLDGLGYLDPATRTIAFSYAHPVFWAPFALVGDGR